MARLWKYGGPLAGARVGGSVDSPSQVRKRWMVEPLPELLEPLAVDELRAFRDDLASRLRKLAAGCA